MAVIQGMIRGGWEVGAEGTKQGYNGRGWDDRKRGAHLSGETTSCRCA